MTSAEWWQKAHNAPGASKAPEADTQLKLLHVLWRLTWKGHRAQAELWGVETDFAWDLRHMIDGQMRSTMLFRGRGGGAEAILAANAKKAELESKGWRE